MRNRTAVGYLVIKPVWRGKHLHSLRFEKVTSLQPKTGTFGAVVIRLSVDIPEHVFRPIEVDANVSVSAEELSAVVARVLPWPAGEPDDPEVDDVA